MTHSPSPPGGAAPAAMAPTDANPEYEFIKQLGAGGMALVFLARKKAPGGAYKEIAFKQILPQFTHDPMRVSKFLEEMAVAAALSHPHIVGVHHWGSYEGAYFIEMELVRGLTLMDLLLKRAEPPAKSDADERFGRLPPALVALLGAQLCEAFDYAHTLTREDVSGFVHRDISPDNVMITLRGLAKVLDYGISKSLKGADRQASKTHTAAGKPYYHPPEQWRGEGIDPRTDLYALGATLSLALCGRQLFPRLTPHETFESIIFRVFQGDRPRVAELAPPDAPPALVALLERLVQADKTQRPASAKELIRPFKDIVRQRAGDLDSAREQLAELVQAHYGGDSDTEKFLEPPRFTDSGVPSRSTRRPIDPATRADRPPAPGASAPGSAISGPSNVARTAALPSGSTPAVYAAAGGASTSQTGPRFTAQAPASSGANPHVRTLVLWAALGAGLVLLVILGVAAGFVFGGALERDPTEPDEVAPEPAAQSTAQGSSDLATTSTEASDQAGGPAPGQAEAPQGGVEQPRQAAQPPAEASETPSPTLAPAQEPTEPEEAAEAAQDTPSRPATRPGADDARARGRPGRGRRGPRPAPPPRPEVRPLRGHPATPAPRPDRSTGSSSFGF